MKVRTLKNGETRGTIKALFEKKENYLVLDTETVNDERIIVEFSGTVINNNFLPLETFSYIIKEVWENEELMSGKYASKNKIAQWKENIEQGHSEVISIYELVTKVNEMIKGYELEILIAYNVGFDKSAYRNTLKYFDMYSNKLQFMKVLDIWYYAIVLFINEEYIDFCIENKFLTPSNNCQTNAEVMYRYLSSKFDFMETHIAKDDIEIELDILKCCAMRDNKPLIGIKQMPCYYISAMKKIKEVK